MTPDEIKSRIFAILYVEEAAILRRYTAPEHLSAAKQRNEINFMVDDIASEVPSGINADAFETLMRDMHQNLRKIARGRAWPQIQQFVQALKLALQDSRLGTVKSTNGMNASNEQDAMSIMRDRINNYEPVPDSYLWGRNALEIVRLGYVSEKQIDNYRDATRKRFRDLYKENADHFIQQLEKRHEFASNY